MRSIQPPSARFGAVFYYREELKQHAIDTDNTRAFTLNDHTYYATGIDAEALKAAETNGFIQTSAETLMRLKQYLQSLASLNPQLSMAERIQQRVKIPNDLKPYYSLLLNKAIVSATDKEAQHVLFEELLPGQ